MKPSFLLKVLILIGSCSTLAACSNIIGPPPAAKIYYLSTDTVDKKAADTVNSSLAVTTPSASQFLDTDRIALVENATEYNYFADAVWADHLPELVQTNILSSFESSGRIGKVARDGDVIHADFKLVTDVRQFEARYTGAGPNPVVTVTIVAYLVGGRSHDIVSSKTFTSTQPCAANNVADVVASLDIALAQVGEGIVDWALKNIEPVQKPM